MECTLLDSQLVREEINREILVYLEIHGNGNTRRQNLWDATKALQRGKFIKISAFVKKKEMWWHFFFLK